MVDVRRSTVVHRDRVWVAARGDIDETAWKLAGRLMLLVHLTDTELMSESGLRTDHERLRRHGYNMAACRCVSERNKRIRNISYGSIPNVAQMAARHA